MTSTLLQVEGLWCGGCARALEKKLGSISGVHRSQVHLESASAELEYDPAMVSLESLLGAARKLGYDMRELDWTGREGGETLKNQQNELSVRLAVGTLLSMWVMLCTVPTYSFSRHVRLFPELEPAAAHLMGLAALLFSALVIAYSGAPFHRMAWRWVQARMVGTDMLVSLGAICSWLLSAYLWWHGHLELYCDGACLLVLLLLTARLVEHSSRRKSRESLAALLQQAPERYQDLEGTWRPVSEALPGETIFRLTSGHSVPLDGLVVGGTGWMDSSVFDGESLPRPMGPGDPIQAGGRVTQGELTVRCLRGLGERRLDRLAQRMRRAQARQGTLGGLAEHAAGGVSAALLLLAGLAAIHCWSEPFRALETAVSLLVVGCPCALTLAVPLVNRTVTDRAAAEGIAFKSGKAIEQLSRLRRFVFDKTGTLSLGRPDLVKISVHQSEWTESEALRLAASLSVGNPHPLSESLRAHCRPEEIPIDHSLMVIPGRGVKTQDSLLGSAELLREAGLNPPDSSGTSCELAHQGRHLATFEFEDPLNPAALAAVRILLGSGGQVAVASGDRPGALESLRNTGIDWLALEGGLTPEDKAGRVDSSTIFVGDGINDCLALTGAGLGVAVGRSSLVALEAADLHLHDVSLLPRAVEWSRAAVKAMQRALIGSMVYNILLLPGAAAGWVTPGWAAVAMGLSSLSVVRIATSVKLRASDTD